MPAAASGHQPVMTGDILRLLAPRAGSVIVDATAGAGGHSAAILPLIAPNGRLIAVDQDADALAQANERLAAFAPNVTFLNANFRALPQLLRELQVSAVDGLIADLGMSSLQVDRDVRGFSFSRTGPLDMRMDRRQELTAEALINESPEDELARVFTTLGEERFARRIARRIVEQRRLQPLKTTTALAEVIWKAAPPAARHGRIHPATRVFQALRMAVNDELGALEALLRALPSLLAPGGRAAILSFHSLEDRLVKYALRDGAREGVWNLLTKKALRPSEDEVRRNPRSRSAKLRAVERR